MDNPLRWHNCIRMTIARDRHPDHREAAANPKTVALPSNRSGDRCSPSDRSWWRTLSTRLKTRNGGPYASPFLHGHGPSLLFCFFEVEAIEVHHLDPGVHEVVHEALLPIGFGVNFSDRAQLRIRTEH